MGAIADYNSVRAAIKQRDNAIVQLVQTLRLVDILKQKNRRLWDKLKEQKPETLEKVDNGVYDAEPVKVVETPNGRMTVMKGELQYYSSDRWSFITDKSKFMGVSGTEAVTKAIEYYTPKIDV